MWEDNLGKVKSRRNINSKPYERPKSILRRVTESVTGLLPQPSWLVNWLHTTPVKDDDNEVEVEQDQVPPLPSTSSANERSNTTQEANPPRESFIFCRPPGLPKEHGNNGKTLLTIPPVKLNVDPSNLETGITSREISIQTNGDEDTHSESTSGCSSLLPHLDRRENREVDLNSVVEPLNLDQSSLRALGNSLSKSLAADLKTSRGRKTLSLHTFTNDLQNEDLQVPKESDITASSSFINKDDLSTSNVNHSSNKRELQPQTSSFSSKRPRFNVTSFGPSVAEARKSMLNDSIVDSPFYAGRTTFGGASAYRRATLQPSATPFPYVRKRVQARPSSVSSAPSTPHGSSAAGTSSNVVLSSSAQRILHALEAMSTPVRDAKRIPANSRRSSFRDEEPSFTGFGLSRRRPNLGPPTSKLPINTPVQVVTQPPVVDKSSQDTSLVASTPINNRGGGKMRSRSSAPPRESSRAREDVEEPVLSTLKPVEMQIDSLPSFGLLLPPPPAPVSLPSNPEPSAAVQKEKPAVVNPPAVTAAVPLSAASESKIVNSSPTRGTYIFSAPVITVSSSVAAAVTTPNPPEFQFSPPTYASPMLNSPQRTAQANKVALAGDAPRNHNQVLQPASELITGSVDDLFKKKDVAPEPKTESKLAVITEEKSVEADPPVTKPLISQGFGDLFKKPTNQWECDACMVRNDQSLSKCCSCESPRPGSKPVASSTPFFAPPTPAAGGFGDQFKKQSNQWECEVCMVRNDQSVSQCSSCESPRPGSKPAPLPSFKFGVATSTTTGFKFGLSAEKSSDKPNDAAPESATAAAPPVFGVVPGSFTSGFKFSTATEATESAPISTAFKLIDPVPASSSSSSTGGFKFADPVPAVAAANFKFGSNPASGTAVSSLSFGGDSSIKPIELKPVAAEPVEKKVDAPQPVVEAEPKKDIGFKFEKTVELVKPAAGTTGFSFGASIEAAKATEGSFTGFQIKTTEAPAKSSETPKFEFGANKSAPMFGSPHLSVSTSKSFGASSTPALTTLTTSPSYPITSVGSQGLSSTTTTKAGDPPSNGGLLGSSSFTPLFGAGSSSESTPKPTLSFGTSSTLSFANPTTQPSTTSAPIFGSNSTTSSSLFNPPKASFSFPSSTAPTTFNAPPSFGAAPSATTPASSAAPATTAPAFVFGEPKSTSTSSVFEFGKTSTSTTTFGSAPPPAYSSAQPPAFNFNPPASTSSSTTAPPFCFGASATSTTLSEAPKTSFFMPPVTPKVSSTSTPSAFGTFPSAPPSFGGFGANPTAAQPATAGIFKFGETALKPVATVFGAPSPAVGAQSPFGTAAPPFGSSAPAVPSSFSFGTQPGGSSFNTNANPSFGGFGVNPAPPQPNQPFQFGPPAPAMNSFPQQSFPQPSFPSVDTGPGNCFEIQNSAPPTGVRKIRKAIRRR